MRAIHSRESLNPRMRRRNSSRTPRRAPNESEATGKIGQEIPKNQPAPIRPSYSYGAGSGVAPVAAPAKTPVVAPAKTPVAAPAKPPVRKIEVETQPESIGTPPAELDGAKPGTVMEPRGHVVLTIGLPGSGKTTWFKRRGVTPLSSDMLRTILFDDITEQRYQGLVFGTLRSLLRARLIAKMPWNYVDATNLSTHERKQWIKMARSFGYDVQAVYFDVPLEVCLERNNARERTVAEDVMRKMAEKLKAPEFDEGFSKITVVRVKK
jgi:predicted kinase